MKQSHVSAKIKISEDKTMLMKVGNVQDNTPVTLREMVLTFLGQFNYLGSIMVTGGGTEADVRCLLGKATAVFQLMHSIWTTSLYPQEPRSDFF